MSTPASSSPPRPLSPHPGAHRARSAATAVLALLLAPLLALLSPGAALAATQDLGVRLRSIEVGWSLQDMALAPDGTRAYVLTRESSLKAVDTTTETVVGTVALDFTPRAVAVTADGSHAYVVAHSPGRDDGPVAVIDTATLTVEFMVTVGGNPTSIAMSPDGTRAYVGCDQATYVIDTRSHRVTSRLSPHLVRNLSLSPDGSRLYTVHHMFDVVGVHDAGTGAPLGWARVDPMNYAVVPSPDAKTIYVASAVGVTAIDAESMQVTHRLTTSPTHHLAVSDDGTRLYASTWNDLVVFDTRTFTRVRSIRTPSPAGALTFLPGRDVAWAVDTGGSTVGVYGPVGGGDGVFDEDDDPGAENPGTAPTGSLGSLGGSLAG